MTFRALTRLPGRDLAGCELSFVARTSIDPGLIAAQHAAYRALLGDLGVEVTVLDPLPGHPDALYVEDTCVVLDRIAILSRPGAETRLGEVAAIEESVAKWRPLARIEAPGTLEGGDVIVIGRTVFIGETARTNAEGIAQFRAFAAPHGYTTIGVPVTGCLHLKSAATALDDHTLIVNPGWVNPANFAGFKVIEIAPGEDDGGNVLKIGSDLVMSIGASETIARVRAAGYRVHPLDISEIKKMEAALTCMSLLFYDQAE